MESRKRWLLSGLSVRGSLTIDDGAAKALRERHTSLLPAGVRDVAGEFGRGETVRILSPEGRDVACGITNYDSADARAISGARSDRIAEILGHDYGTELVHRDNLVLV
jgi:glutamate 5-kinase